MLKLRGVLEMSVGCSGCDLMDADVRVMVRVIAAGSLKVATANVFICRFGGVVIGGVSRKIEDARC